MISGYLLDAVVAVAGLIVLPTLLHSSRAFDVRPRVGLAVWFLLGALGWSGFWALALRVALGNARQPLALSISKFVSDVTSGHPLRGFGLKEVLGLSIALDLGILLIGGWIVAASSIWQRRHEQRALLDLIGTYDQADPSLRLLLHDQPIAYYIPGSGGRVVLSRGTTQILSDDELAAVIAHEHGHGSGHHSSLLVPLQALSPFVWVLPYARFAPRAVGAYVEMAADDHGRRLTTSEALRRALGKADVLCAPPLGAIGWNSAYVERRLIRLDARPTPFANAFLLVSLVVVTLPIMWSIAGLR